VAGVDEVGPPCRESPHCKAESGPPGDQGFCALICRPDPLYYSTMAADDPLPGPPDSRGSASQPHPPAVTRLLQQAREGDAGALDQVFSVTYAELRSIAGRHFRRERSDHTLQPTALLHEAVLRLFGGRAPVFADRSHFLRAASRAMRHALVDHARARAAAKRGGGAEVTQIQDVQDPGASPLDVLELDEALRLLAQADPRCAQVVEMKFFVGLEVEEIAEVLEISTATVKRDWRFARSWLAQELGGDR
jgi:RNA polymerase sigma-70 factor, ECF subfamily